MILSFYDSLILCWGLGIRQWGFGLSRTLGSLVRSEKVGTSLVYLVYVTPHLLTAEPLKSLSVPASWTSGRHPFLWASQTSIQLAYTLLNSVGKHCKDTAGLTSAWDSYCHHHLSPDLLYLHSPPWSPGHGCNNDGKAQARVLISSARSLATSAGDMRTGFVSCSGI